MSSPPQVLWILFGGVVALILSGAAWLAWFPAEDNDPLENLAEAIGLSLSLTALAALLAFLLSWRISSVGLIGSYASIGLLALIGFARQWATGKGKASNTAGQILRGGLRFIVPLLSFVVLLLWRFYQVRELVLPAWVDSLHHVLIVRVILENGGLPQTLEPYLPVPFYYHFAFHTLTAVFAFLARATPSQAVLWVGQVLNVAAALSVYRLGKALFADWRRAGVAALLVGFVTQMPAYYVTWGRYTLLAGLVLLPLAMAAAIETARGDNSRSQLAKLAVFAAGTLLAHYFTALLLALFLLLLGLHALWRDLTGRKIQRGEGADQLLESGWLSLTAGALIGVLLTLPWLLRMWGYAGSGIEVSTVFSSAQVDAAYFPNYLSYLWRMAGPKRNYVLLFLAPLGLATSSLRPATRPFALWAAILGLLSLPWGVRLSPFRSDHAVIVLFLPVSVLIADFWLSAAERLRSGGLPRAGKGLVGALILGFLVWGLRDTRSIINRSTILATGADLRAIEWIAQNAPPEARFLINVVHWQYGTYRGVDGGWWIPLLTGRETLLPTVLYEWAETDYVSQVNALARQVSELKTCDTGFWDVIRTAGITHIYLGSVPGSLKTAGLAGCEGISLIYDTEEVHIYEIVSPIQ